MNDESAREKYKQKVELLLRSQEVYQVVLHKDIQQKQLYFEENVVSLQSKIKLLFVTTVIDNGDRYSVCGMYSILDIM